MRTLSKRFAIIGLIALAAVSTGVTAQAAAPGCRVDYGVPSQWPGGFSANVTVTNLGDPINGWQLVWSYTAGQAVTSAWNATITQSGGQVTAVDAGHNAALATGATASFGFNASWNNSSNPAPASFALNGTVCTGTVPSPTPTQSPSPSPSPSQSPSPSPSPTSIPAGAKQVEDLDRGLISVRSGSANLVSWRLLGTEASATTFNVYRGGTRVATVSNSTNYLDTAAADASYTVRAVVNGAEQAASPASLRFTGGNYLDVPIQPPGGGTTPSGEAYTYAANDASVGDLDGDGDYEFVLKWDPSNAKDNSQSGYTGNVYVDAYTLTGTRLWRINLGRNIRAGAHYTQFQVYDYDGDGDAEVAMKTADGTTSGTGQVIGSSTADYRNTSGYVLSGPEFLTMFDGRTGAALSTVNYDPARGTVSSWGDNYGNRVDRFLAGTAYLDGTRPSLIMSRGYYTRTVIAAWDFRNGTLTRRWTFDSNSAGSQYAGQGNHQLSIADVDQDGRDEIIFGAMTINDNGSPLWNTGLGHGDALHVGDLNPSRSGLEVFKVSEETARPGSWFADARTGQVLWQTASGADNGRGVSADIWAGSPGAESWSASDTTLRSATGASLGREPSSINFLAWWDGDPVRELVDATRVDKYGTSGDTRLLTASGVHSNNGTKATPSLSGDILGDWREEVIWPTTANTALRIYATTSVTDRKIHTLAHDPMYRVAIAWQNTAYNQPPHPSFFIGDGMATPAKPNVYVR
ncbi:rhamnogalacturonan lyase [Acrocarpospora macrocephala]|uniref:Rhamnogalacturonan lyase n=1 Tax=Acrocarpospora macrocephala TaxID=150177 RepID=A0A5M3X8N5_9ACTN|nr:cellulose binding domain-containing protein [Acrocarpospora macrocephala]GES17016.1 rhamnogalacturonan lyase [Acrocarpospora macrocephala]